MNELFILFTCRDPKNHLELFLRLPRCSLIIHNCHHYSKNNKKSVSHKEIKKEGQ